MTRRTKLAGGVFAAGLVVVLVWFQPQALLINRTVDEALLSATTSSSTPSAAPDSAEATENLTLTEVPDPQAVRRGSFSSRNRYTVKGRAEIYELAGGRRVLRLEDFSSTNGPDLRVYLSPEGSSAGDDALAEGFVDSVRSRATAATRTTRSRMTLT